MCQPDADARDASAIGTRRFFDGRARHDAFGSQQRDARTARIDLASINEERHGSGRLVT